jgi:hypothetical protein
MEVAKAFTRGGSALLPKKSAPSYINSPEGRPLVHAAYHPSSSSTARPALAWPVSDQHDHECVARIDDDTTRVMASIEPPRQAGKNLREGKCPTTAILAPARVGYSAL